MSYVTEGMRAELAQNSLRLLHQSEGAWPIQAWRLGREGTRIFEIIIMFTPEGIVISGDVRISANGGSRARGVVSDRHYGIQWFGSNLSEGYLCEKFLDTVFRRDLAVSYFEETLSEKLNDLGYDGADREDIHDAIERACGDEYTKWDFFDDTNRLALEPEDAAWGYPLKDAGWLCAIQQRFAKLWSGGAKA